MDDGAADTVERLLAAADAISSLPAYSTGYTAPQSNIAQNYAVKVAQSHIDMAKLSSLQLPYAVPCATRVWLVVKYVSLDELWSIFVSKSSNSYDFILDISILA